MADLTIRIAGEAGQGLVSIGEVLARSFVESGLHIFSGQSYMSRIRGGLNWVDIRIGDTELYSLREHADLLVALSEPAIHCLVPTLATDARIIRNCHKTDSSPEVVCFDFAKVAASAGGNKRMINSVAAGAIFAILDLDLDNLISQIRTKYRHKSIGAGEMNVSCANAGFDQIKEKGITIEAPRRSAGRRGTLVSGASATALSAAAAGVKFVASYPMSPSTATFTHLAKLSDENGILIEQAEDEIAAINMVCGASYAGVTSMTTTSGGGFALMGEGISLAGMMELPVLVLLAQRPGPATGLPTRTAQEDLNLAVHAGHGEFPKAVFAPGDQRQCYNLMRHAVFTSNKYQIPVILLTDQYLQDAMKDIDPLDTHYEPIDRFITEDADDMYRRYHSTPDGISPRAIPGGEGPVVCDSDEHDEAGHLNEDLRIRIEQQQKRMRKEYGLVDQAVEPEVFGPADAENVIVCWGSSYGPVKETVKILNLDGRSAAMLHFSQVWPLNIENILGKLESYKRIIVAEGNYTGQFASLLRRAGCTRHLERLNRYDGLPLTADFVIRGAKI